MLEFYFLWEIFFLYFVSLQCLPNCYESLGEVGDKIMKVAELIELEKSSEHKTLSVVLVGLNSPFLLLCKFSKLLLDYFF
jgi:hypothetical protein